jgi:hypothetical protein
MKLKKTIIFFFFFILLIKPRGGVASLLAQSDKKPLVELRAESVSLFFVICTKIGYLT